MAERKLRSIQERAPHGGRLVQISLTPSIAQFVDDVRVEKGVTGTDVIRGALSAAKKIREVQRGIETGEINPDGLSARTLLILLNPWP